MDLCYFRDFHSSLYFGQLNSLVFHLFFYTVCLWGPSLSLIIASHFAFLTPLSLSLYILLLFIYLIFFSFLPVEREARKQLSEIVITNMPSTFCWEFSRIGGWCLPCLSEPEKRKEYRKQTHQQVRCAELPEMRSRQWWGGGVEKVGDVLPSLDVYSS